MREELKAELDSIIQDHKVVLFMKGNRAAPSCGFSASVVAILTSQGADFHEVDVISRPDIRDAIKEYSDWPTIPQLYVGGEFVGGADIIADMDKSGELGKLLGTEATEPPTIGLTDAAMKAMMAARTDDDGPYLRLEISPEYEHGLYFDDKRDGDFIIDRKDISLVVDKGSAVRAKDIHIDYIESKERTGFKIDNPNKRRNAPKKAAVKMTVPSEPPTLTITDAAVAQFRTAIDEEEAEAKGTKFGIKVAAKRMGEKKVDYDLGVIPTDEKGDHDFAVTYGDLPFFIDRISSRYLEGATIDFVEQGASSGFKFSNPVVDQGWTTPLQKQFQKLLDDEINPSIAAHGGVIELLDIQGDTAFVVMGGGCQGCGQASQTLTEGVEKRVREVIPEIAHLVDTTNHAVGTNPYYQA